MVTLREQNRAGSNVTCQSPINKHPPCPPSPQNTTVLSLYLYLYLSLVSRSLDFRTVSGGQVEQQEPRGQPVKPQHGPGGRWWWRAGKTSVWRAEVRESECGEREGERRRERGGGREAIDLNGERETERTPWSEGAGFIWRFEFVSFCWVFFSFHFLFTSLDDTNVLNLLDRPLLVGCTIGHKPAPPC